MTRNGMTRNGTTDHHVVDLGDGATMDHIVVDLGDGATMSIPRPSSRGEPASPVIASLHELLSPGMGNAAAVHRLRVARQQYAREMRR